MPQSALWVSQNLPSYIAGTNPRKLMPGGLGREVRTQWRRHLLILHYPGLIHPFMPYPTQKCSLSTTLPSPLCRPEQHCMRHPAKCFHVILMGQLRPPHWCRLLFTVLIVPYSKCSYRAKFIQSEKNNSMNVKTQIKNNNHALRRLVKKEISLG